MDGTAAAFSMGMIELRADVVDNPLGTIRLVLVGVLGTGSCLGEMGVGSVGMMLACLK